MTSCPVNVVLAFLGECPSQGAAITAICLYAFMTLASLVITVKTRCWFVLFVPLTAMLEAFGYGVRLNQMRAPTYDGYVAMQCLLIIPPVLLAIVDYACLGRIIALAKPEDVPPNLRRLAPWISRAFTASDVLCLGIQGFAAAMTCSKDAPTAQIGQHVMLAGLALQLVFFTLFLSIAVSERTATLHTLVWRLKRLPATACIGSLPHACGQSLSCVRSPAAMLRLHVTAQRAHPSAAAPPPSVHVHRSMSNAAAACSWAACPRCGPCSSASSPPWPSCTCATSSAPSSPSKAMAATSPRTSSSSTSLTSRPS